MQVIISKGELWDLLGDRALVFSNFLESSGTGQAIKNMLYTSSVKGEAGCIDLNSTLIQTQLLPSLLALGIIDQGVIDRVNARIAQESSPSYTSIRRFKVPLTDGIVSEEQIRDYIQPHVVGLNPYISFDGSFIIVEVAGNCTAPGTQEVF